MLSIDCSEVSMYVCCTLYLLSEQQGGGLQMDATLGTQRNSIWATPPI